MTGRLFDVPHLVELEFLESTPEQRQQAWRELLLALNSQSLDSTEAPYSGRVVTRVDLDGSNNSWKVEFFAAWTNGASPEEVCRIARFFNWTAFAFPGTILNPSSARSARSQAFSLLVSRLQSLTSAGEVFTGRVRVINVPSQ